MDDLSVIEYFRTASGGSFWVGLKKIVSGTMCTNANCNDVLKWEDGTSFKRDKSVHSAVVADGAGSQDNCFSYNLANQFNDEDCQAHSIPFICQFTCKGIFSA